jgi:hypothetical protein
MELNPQTIREHLAIVDRQGWDSPAGRALLEAVRSAVVQPIVRRSGLRGCAADQAESSGWAAAWDALRRPSALTAANPGGMVWVAVRRAVWAEVAGGRGVDRHVVASPAVPAESRTAGHLSLEAVRQAGWEPAAHGHDPGAATIGPLLQVLAQGLVAVGWEPEVVVDVIVSLADQARSPGQGGPNGGRGLRCRVVSQQLGLPQWQVRRIAEVVVGGHGWPAVPALIREHGPAVVGEGVVHMALRSTTRRWMASPRSLLADWQACPGCVT